MSVKYEELVEFADYLPAKCFRVSDSKKAHYIAEHFGAIATASKSKSNPEHQRLDNSFYSDHETHWVVIKRWSYEGTGYCCVWLYPKTEFFEGLSTMLLADADAKSIENR